LIVLGLLQLTWRYLTFHKVKTLLLLLALTLTFFLPIAAGLLVRFYEADLNARAKATPLVAGTPGDRFDLVLKSLYFTGEAPPALRYADYSAVVDEGRGSAIPLYLEFTAGGRPLVATTPEYYRFRNLQPAAGTLPLQVGDAVLGHTAAEELGIAVGDTLPTDQVNLYDLSAAYPLRMKVVGVLAPAGTPDDGAVFASLETGWVVAGHGHGHEELDRDTGGGKLLGRGDDSVTASAAVEQFIEITPENIADFHFHGDRSDLPVTSIIAVPDSDKNRTLLKGKFAAAKNLQLLVPTEVIGELLGIVFRVKRFFDASFALVLAAAVLFLTLVVLLSLRLRRDERQTLFNMGCSRGTIAIMQVAELAIIGLAALFLAGLGAAALLLFAPDLAGTLGR
jgi:putative ABC transport system permease protein